MSVYDYENVRRDNVNKIINMLTDFLSIRIRYLKTTNAVINIRNTWKPKIGCTIRLTN